MNQIRWNIAISADTDKSLRLYLSSQGYGREEDLSRFIEEAVRAHILELTAKHVKSANIEVSEKKLTAIVDEAVQWARSLRGRRSRSEMGGKRAQFCSDFEDCSPATAGKTGRKWDFSPPIAADSLLPRRLLATSDLLSAIQRRTTRHHEPEVIYLSTEAYDTGFPPKTAGTTAIDLLLCYDFSFSAASKHAVTANALYYRKFQSSGTTKILSVSTWQPSHSINRATNTGLVSVANCSASLARN
ncbi:hypothetical protein AAKU67_000159 [Oxalobacteraceae bacterium GrIS 2.11]